MTLAALGYVLAFICLLQQIRTTSRQGSWAWLGGVIGFTLLAEVLRRFDL